MVNVTIDHSLVQHAKSIIDKAEKDLGALTDGQRRDLLADNTNWHMETIRFVVETIAFNRS